jgi:oxygen-dependent protoporphyrinogen oxidase
MGDFDFDVAVVGAGISGLAFAHHVVRAGARCAVLEEAPAAGGCIHTARGPDGFWFEMGAHTLYNSYASLLAILVDLEMRKAVATREKAPYRLLVGGKLRSVPSQLAWGELFASAWRAFTLHKDGRTVGDYYGRLVGKRNWSRVFSPLLSAVPSQRADDLPAEMLFKRRPRNKEFPRTFTLQDGLSTLTHRLASQEGISLRTGAGVTDLARSDQGFALASTEGRTVRARSVALAVPPDRASRLLEPLLPAAAAVVAPVRTATVDSTGVVCARSDLSLPRFAGLVPLDDDFFSAVTRDVVPDERYRALAFHFRAGLTLDQRLARIAGVLGTEPRRFAQVSELRSVLPSPSLGHAGIVRALDENLVRSGMYVTGNYFGGLAIEDCVQRSRAEAQRWLAERG